MSSKSFVLVLVGVLVLGGTIGGSFVAGLVVGGGDSAEAEAAANVVTLPSPGGSGATAQTTEAPPVGSLSLAEIRQQVESGELTQDDVAQLRQQFQRGGIGGATGGFEGGLAGGALSGALESVEGDKITVNTAQGPLQVTIGPETVIQRTEVVTLTSDDLVEGIQVRVAGERNEVGVVEAVSIFVVPEGDAAFGGFGGFGGRRPGGGGFGGGQ